MLVSMLRRIATSREVSSVLSELMICPVKLAFGCSIRMARCAAMSIIGHGIGVADSLTDESAVLSAPTSCPRADSGVELLITLAVSTTDDSFVLGEEVGVMVSLERSLSSPFGGTGGGGVVHAHAGQCRESSALPDSDDSSSSSWTAAHSA